MAIPISHEECWNRLQRLGVEHQAMKYELDESAAELDRLRSVNAEMLEALKDAVEHIDGWADKVDRRCRAVIEKAERMVCE